MHSLCVWIPLTRAQLSKRFERREEAKEEGEEAKETGMSLNYCTLALDEPTGTGTAEDMDRFSRRTVKVTREHNEECRKLLGLMGIPFVVVSPRFVQDHRSP